GCELLAFVYMPDHVHLLVRPPCFGIEVERLAQQIGRPFAQRVRRTLEETDSTPLLGRLTQRRGNGRPTFRFWQPGPPDNVALASRGAVLRAMARLHNNPVRRGLCLSPAEWRWSSWCALHGGEMFRDSALPRVVRLRRESAGGER
ncbi:MAG TPA: transposase, partial [Thermoanaerobaculia bacterium]